MDERTNTVTAQEHYERLLSDHYSWSLGDFMARVASQREWRMKKSAYAKLRLPQVEVTRWLVESGFAVVEQVPMAQGLTGIVAR